MVLDQNPENGSQTPTIDFRKDLKNKKTKCDTYPHPPIPEYKTGPSLKKEKRGNFNAGDDRQELDMALQTEELAAQILDQDALLDQTTRVHRHEHQDHVRHQAWRPRREHEPHEGQKGRFRTSRTPPKQVQLSPIVHGLEGIAINVSTTRHADDSAKPSRRQATTTRWTRIPRASRHSMHERFLRTVNSNGNIFIEV